MIGLRMFEGALLAVLVGFLFRRAWRWEHGEGPHELHLGETSAFLTPMQDNPLGREWALRTASGPRVRSGEKLHKETGVFFAPTTLFWLMLAFFGCYLWLYGLWEGVVRFAAVTAEVMIFLSFYFVLLLAVLPLLRRWFSARVCAVLWLVPAFLTFPTGGVLNHNVPAPRWTIWLPHRALSVIAAVWLAGFLAVGGYYLISHLRFCRWVRAHTAEEQSVSIRAIWTNEQERLQYRRQARLLRGDVPSPFSMGQTKRSRCTVLPNRDYTHEELALIFRHELHHLQRNDVDTKVFLCLCNALCWFNPLVWIATRKAAEDLERSCDEIVTEGMEQPERLAYAHLILDAAAPVPGCTTCLSAAAGTLRYRLKGILDRRRRMVGTLLLMAATFCGVLCFGVVSVSDARGSFASLALLPEEEIRQASDSTGNVRGAWWSSKPWDAAALQQALAEIELEHIARPCNPIPEGESLALWTSDHRTLVLSDQALIVYDYRDDKGRTDCFLVKSPIDWDAVHTILST